MNDLTLFNNASKTKNGKAGQDPAGGVGISTPASAPEQAKGAPYIAPAMAAPTDSDFDWTDKEDVVVPSQPSIAVYWNPAGAVVIRQETYAYDGDDMFVFVRPEHLAELIDRLVEFKKQAGK